MNIDISEFLIHSITLNRPSDSYNETGEGSPTDTVIGTYDALCRPAVGDRETIADNVTEVYDWDVYSNVVIDARNGDFIYYDNLTLVVVWARWQSSHIGEYMKIKCRTWQTGVS